LNYKTNLIDLYNTSENRGAKNPIASLGTILQPILDNIKKQRLLRFRRGRFYIPDPWIDGEIPQKFESIPKNSSNLPDRLSP